MLWRVDTGALCWAIHESAVPADARVTAVSFDYRGSNVMVCTTKRLLLASAVQSATPLLHQGTSS